MLKIFKVNSSVYKLSLLRKNQGFTIFISLKSLYFTNNCSFVAHFYPVKPIMIATLLKLCLYDFAVFCWDFSINILFFLEEKFYPKFKFELISKFYSPVLGKAK